MASQSTLCYDKRHPCDPPLMESRSPPTSWKLLPLSDWHRNTFLEGSVGSMHTEEFSQDPLTSMRGKLEARGESNPQIPDHAVVYLYIGSNPR